MDWDDDPNSLDSPAGLLPERRSDRRLVASQHVHLLTGAIGKPGAGPLLMAGQPSAMSNREAGADGSYPGYRNPHSEKQMRDSALWNIDFDNFHPEVPKDILLMMETAERGEIEFMWVIGTNPLVSLPDQNRTRTDLERCSSSCRTRSSTPRPSSSPTSISRPLCGAKRRVASPTPSAASTCCLRRSSRRARRAATSTSSSRSRAVWGSRIRMARRSFPFGDPQEAFEEWRKVSKGRPCDYSGMTYDLILEMGAVRWPCNEEHPRGSERLYEDFRFWTGIDDCESYGADFLTGNKDTRGLRIYRPERKGLPEAGAMAAPAKPDDRGLSVPADHGTGGLPLPYPHEDGASVL